MLPSLPATHHLPLTPSSDPLLISLASGLSTPLQPLLAPMTQWATPWGSYCMPWPLLTSLSPRLSLQGPPIIENPCPPLLRHQESTTTTATIIGTTQGQNGTLTSWSSTSASFSYPM